MTRFAALLVLTAVAAGVLAGAALAKEGGVELGSTPSALGPGDPWTPSLTLIDDGGQLPANAKPGIKITNLETGRTIDYPATPTDNPAVYTVRVVFPTPGQWDYAAYDGVTDRLYEFPATTILAPQGTVGATPEAAATAEEGSFPLWPLLGGLGGAGLLALGALAAIRSRKFAHS